MDRETLDCTQIDQFSQVSLALYCMGIKTLFLPRDTLAMTQNKTFSDVSVEWLQYKVYRQNIMLKHELRGSEQ